MVRVATLATLSTYRKGWCIIVLATVFVAIQVARLFLATPEDCEPTLVSIGVAIVIMAFGGLLTLPYWVRWSRRNNARLTTLRESREHDARARARRMLERYQHEDYCRRVAKGYANAIAYLRRVQDEMRIRHGLYIRLT